MKNRNIFKDLAVLMGTSILFFWTFTARAESAHAIASACETLLMQMDSRKTSLLDTLAELDYLKPRVPYNMAMQIDVLVEGALTSDSSDERLFADSKALLGQIIASIAPATCTVGEPQTCLGDAIGNVSLLEAETEYQTGDLHLKTVSFEDRALKEMQKLDDLTVERLLRSIKKGFVPPVSGPGVVRLTDIHRALVEVKIVKKGVTRLIGCFESGHLYVKRVYHKRNEGRGSALGNYRDLCD